MGHVLEAYFFGQASFALFLNETVAFEVVNADAYHFPNIILQAGKSSDLAGK